HEVGEIAAVRAVPLDMLELRHGVVEELGIVKHEIGHCFPPFWASRPWQLARTGHFIPIAQPGPQRHQAAAAPPRYAVAEPPALKRPVQGPMAESNRITSSMPPHARRPRAMEGLEHGVEGPCIRVRMRLHQAHSATALEPIVPRPENCSNSAA